MNSNSYEALAGRTLSPAEPVLGRVRRNTHLLGFLAQLRHGLKPVEHLADTLKREMFYGQDKGLKYKLPALPPGTSNFHLAQLAAALNVEKIDLIHCALGIVSEAGELMECLMRCAMDGEALDVPNLKEEIGDAQWYFAIPCRAYDFTLEECEDLNIEKLALRYGDAFSDVRAIERDLSAERQVLEKDPGSESYQDAFERLDAQETASRALLEAAGFPSIVNGMSTGNLPDAIGAALMELKQLRDEKVDWVKLANDPAGYLGLPPGGPRVLDMPMEAGKFPEGMGNAVIPPKDCQLQGNLDLNHPRITLPPDESEPKPVEVLVAEDNIKLREGDLPVVSRSREPKEERQSAEELVPDRDSVTVEAMTPPKEEQFPDEADAQDDPEQTADGLTRSLADGSEIEPA